LDLKKRDFLPFEESYWVIPGLFLAGEYPGRREEQETRKRIQGLIQAGIRSCIDLTKPGELEPSYREIFLEELSLYDFEGDYYHFPIYDFGVPDTDQLVRTLDKIDESITDNQPVYVHCRAGIGRTGLVVGCYLARHGRTGNEALMAIRQLRSSVSSSWMQSPETDAQVNFVRNWGRGD
jgi:protein-tyrosine phosphatase